MRSNRISRRQFATTALGGAAALCLPLQSNGAESHANELAVLPKGPTPEPLALPHFPDRMHAFIWRNWELVPVEKVARVLGTSASKVTEIATAMGLPKRQRITADQQRRSYLSVIKRNWHLLPYSQLLELLGWSAEKLAFVLREDDFLYIKLGGLKPKCGPVRYAPPDDKARAGERQIARVIREELGSLTDEGEPLFGFVEQLSKSPRRKNQRTSAGPLRFCYSYFALYGDPLLEPEADPYPDGYLARLAEAGVNGVWLQAVLYKLARFPWQPELSERFEARIENLRKLVARARSHGIGIFLYLNEPRSMRRPFFDDHSQLKGVTEGEFSTLCTSQPEVREYLTDSVASICRAVPKLAGFFTITASENLTNCWSHHGGANCPRCSKRLPAEVIAEVNASIFEGIRRAGTGARLLAWDWGWSNAWAEDAINRLPKEVTLLSVSEWDLPINRGGVASTVGEYSISSIGPGPRAKRHWAAAKKRGIEVAAKIQAGNTWELSAVPYIPALRNVAEHIANLREIGVENIMLGWTLGGYPSPNLEVVQAVAEIKNDPAVAKETLVDQALLSVAERRFGKKAAKFVVEAWNAWSRAFSEFPYHGGVVYSAPLQVGPANLLWTERTKFQASMVGLPYDDVEHWRGIYPAETFIAQLEKVAVGFEAGIRNLAESAQGMHAANAPEEAFLSEVRVAQAAAIHFRSVANQTRFILARDKLKSIKEAEIAGLQLKKLEQLIRPELTLARRLYDLQRQDSRIGFEASNQYYYVPTDLIEKILNCRDLLDQWLPEERRKRGL